MKKIIYTAVILISFKSFGQSAITRILDSDPRISTTLRSNNVYDPTKNNNTIEGNPYTNPNFALANIPSINAPINFRYNAYKDLIEFKDAENIYELPKDKAYSPIILQNNTKIVLENNKDGSTSYYTELYSNNDISLLRKDKVYLSDPKATDGYREATPAKFSSLKTEYFLKKNDVISEFPKNKKAVLNSFNNSEIENYLKKNTSFLKNENQLIELTKLITQHK